MTVEGQLEEAGKKRTRVSGTYEKEFPFEPSYEPSKPLQEPMRDFHTRNDGQFDHMGFQIRREPNYQLWKVFKDGKPVKAIDCLYTTVSIAQKAIDEYLRGIVRKIKNGNKRTKKNNNTPN